MAVMKTVTFEDNYGSYLGVPIFIKFKVNVLDSVDR